MSSKLKHYENFSEYQIKAENEIDLLSSKLTASKAKTKVLKSMV